MKHFSRATVALFAAFFTMALAPGATLAQNDRVLCPNPLAPVSITRGGTTAATPMASEFSPGTPLSGMTYNQTSDNQSFRDTIVFRKPSTKLCCRLDALPRTGYYGKLTVTYKALDEGPTGSHTSYNDSGGLVYLGASVPGQSGWIYPQGSFVANNQIAVRTYFLSAAIVQSGRVSFAVQDDTAVVSAKLEVPGGCCLQPTTSDKGP
ncbi:MAG TPA: hypothetical protein VNF68_06630 [Candidatus Baltobacteraceae bacterium]|nr:hypothetical protein [Candidatus Baltobacteraceae bacterium]